MIETLANSHLPAPGPVLNGQCDLGLAAGELCLRRAATSSAPVFYFLNNGSSIVLSDACPELLEKIKAAGHSLTADRRYAAEYLAFQAPLTARTAFEEIRLLRAGECVVFRDFCPVRSTISALEPTPGGISADGLKARVEALLAPLKPEETSFQVSSGLDSTLLAILAQHLWRNQRLRLCSCKTRGRGCSDELAVVEELAGKLDAELEVFDFTDIDVFEKGQRFIAKCCGYPLVHPSHLVEYLMDEALAGTGAKTVINGKGPDDCLAGYEWHLPEYAAPDKHGSRVLVTPPESLNTLLRSGFDNDLFEFWNRNGSPLTLQERMEYDRLTLTEGWNVVHGGIMRGLAIELLSPYMDPVIRTGLRGLPENQKLVGRKQKVFFREAFADLYPDSVLSAPKRPLRLDLRPYFMEYGEAELLRTILGGNEWATELFDVAGVRRMIDATFRGEQNCGWQLWSVFCLSTAYALYCPARETQP